MTIVQPKIEIRLLYSLTKYKHPARLYQQNKTNNNNDKKKKKPPFPCLPGHISVVMTNTVSGCAILQH